MGKVLLSNCHKDAHHLAKLRQHTDAQDDFWLAVVRLCLDGVLEDRDRRTESCYQAASITAKRAVAACEEREA